jgi:serine O-acetyltransferase
MRVVREIVRDTLAVAHTLFGTRIGPREVAAAALHDGVQALALSRVRQAALRWNLGIIDSVARRTQKALFGIDIGREAILGEGIFFAHTVGIVIGGDARIGDRVMFLGCNTVGSIRQDDFPRIGNDVIIGAGARILGAISIGDGAAIGANAVVLRNVPTGASAYGVPAVVHERNASDGTDATATDGRP